MEQKNDRLQQKLLQAWKTESLGTMATGVAHDFNNVLAAILGNVNIILRNVPPGSPAESSARQIESSVSSAIELANQMLVYTGKGKADMAELDVSSLIREMTHVLGDSVSKSVDIAYDLADDLPPVTGDADQIRQVMKNLIRNASDAMVDENGIVTVSSGVLECDRDCIVETYLYENQPEGRYVYVEVSDTGSGMSPEVEARMFDPFFSTKIRGRGMSLAVVLGVVRAHGGAVKIRTAPQQGTTISILLPCDNSSA